MIRWLAPLLRSTTTAPLLRSTKTAPLLRSTTTAACRLPTAPKASLLNIATAGFPLLIATAPFPLTTALAQAANLTVLTAGAMQSVAAAMTPAFEASSENKVTLRNDTVGALLRRIRGGEAFDVVLISPAGLDDLAKSGKIEPKSRINLARVGIGVGIKLGSPAPDISTVAAFKTAILQARAIAYIDPASGGSSGIYLAKLFQTLGIADTIAARSVLISGGLAATAVVDGRASIVLQQISEIIAVPGVTLVGPLPAPIQNQTFYAGAVAAGSASPDAAHALLAALAGPDAHAVLLQNGLSQP